MNEFTVIDLAREAGVEAEAARPGTRVVCGGGVAERAGVEAKNSGMSRVLVVTDAGVREAGHADRVAEVLGEAGLAVEVWDEVTENPTTATVEAGLGVAGRVEPDGLVAVGGGSAIDAAKGVNFLYTHGGRMIDYKGRDTATKPMLPLVALPTTAGTGSEVQSFALISDAQTHVKMACGDIKAAPVVSLLDPELAVTAPRRVKWLAGIDAVVHAVECAVTTRRGELSGWLAERAFADGHRALETVLTVEAGAGTGMNPAERPPGLGGMRAMQLAACHAGLAIENSMLGAAHASANPLTAQHGIAHGHAVGLMLPAVVRMNATGDGQAAEQYRRLAIAGGLASDEDADAGAAVDALVGRLWRLFELGGVPGRLRELGVGEGDLASLAADACEQWTGTFNPVVMDAEKFEALYRAVW